jgi:hypothetical protein
MFGTKQQIIENIDELMVQAMDIIVNRRFGSYITNVYWAGGTMCIDVRYSSTVKFTVMVNINGEQFNVVRLYDHEESQSLLPLESLKIAFMMYEKVRGKNKYYEECFSQSCLRHLDNPFELKNIKY